MNSTIFPQYKSILALLHRASSPSSLANIVMRWYNSMFFRDIVFDIFNVVVVITIWCYNCRIEKVEDATKKWRLEEKSYVRANLYLLDLIFFAILYCAIKIFVFIPRLQYNIYSYSILSIPTIVVWLIGLPIRLMCLLPLCTLAFPLIFCIILISLRSLHLSFCR